MKGKISTETKQYIVCPVCGNHEAFGISHLMDGSSSAFLGSFGPWYCDSCGHSITGKVSNGEVEIELYDQRCIPTLDLLIYYKDLDKPSAAKKTYVVVKGMRFEGGKFNDDNSHKDYFYDEHTCPTNYLKVEMVLEHQIVDKDEGDPGDTDPHGIFQYLASIDYKGNKEKLENCHNSHSVLSLFGIV